MTRGLNIAVEELARALPRGAVSVAEADRLAVCADLWPRHLIRLAVGESWTFPRAVVWPESTHDLQRIVKVARRHGIGLVPYGAGSSVVGGATPQADQIVVDLKRMDRVLEIDPRAWTATAQAGIIGEILERQLVRAGYTQGHFPSSIYCSSLGGWIAARSAGQMSSRYGKIEDQVVGGVLVRGDGRVFCQAGAPVRSAEFDSLIGAEGSLCLWSEATVRIYPLPARRAWRGLTFPDLASVVECVKAWLRAGISPCVVRIYDALDTMLHHQSRSRQVARDRGPSRLAWLGATFPRLTSWVGDRLAGRLFCVVGVQGDQRQVELEQRILLDLAQQHGAEDLGSEPGEDWYAHRYAISYQMSRAFRAGAAVDTMEVACTWDRIVSVYDAVRRVALGAGAQILAHFSHVYLEGGSIYFTFALPISRGVEGYDELWRVCLRAAAQAGANVSHHHGTGKLKAEALAAALGGARASWAKLQRELDPDRVLNPNLLDVSRSRGRGRADDESTQRRGGTEMVPVAPNDTLAAIEQDWRSRGLSLGPVAALFPERSVVQLARRRWLWGVNSQLRLIESLLMGVDGQYGGQRHRFTPAPRAAMGPNLTDRLLEHEVERLWLKTAPLRNPGVRAEGLTTAVLELNRRIARDEASGNAAVVVTGEGGRSAAQIWFPEGPRGELSRQRVLEQIDEVGELVVTECVDLPSIPGRPLMVSGVWSVIQRVVAVAPAEGARFVLPWSDGLGAAGFLFGEKEPLGPDSSKRLRLFAKEMGALPEEAGQLEDEPPPERARGSGEKAVSQKGPALTGRLSVAAHVSALENCTYCPKLCRFACPVGVADGNEAMIPRQLMLTVNLARKGQLRLGPDVAARIWSCVDCRSCQTFCEHGTDVASALTAARAEMIRLGGGPPQVRSYLSVLAKTGRPPNRSVRDRWLEQLEGDGERSPTWLFLGCDNSSSDLAPARAALALARRHFGRVHVINGPIACCGHPLWRWGEPEAFQRHARAFAGQLGNARRLVVDEPGCAYALGTLYERVGVAMPTVVTVTSLLAQEKWRPARREKWAVHDDAFSLRWLHEPSLRGLWGLREVLWPRGSILEGEAGSCGGSLLSVYDPVLADRVTRACVTDLLRSGAQRILAISPSCTRRLREVGAPVDNVLSLWHEVASDW